jgi:iron complex transport system ATP-binding protein
MKVSAAGISVVIEGAPVLTGIELHAGPGEVIGLVGPNGSGKSTLLRCIYRALKPVAGHVELGDDDVWRLSARQAGRRSAVVTQDHDLDIEYSVDEVVAMGRILDEPTNHLDVGAQLELLDLVRQLKLTTIAALHDLDHATAYCDQLVLLKRGRVAATGTPQEVLTPQRVHDVFGVRSAVVAHPLTGRPHLVTAAPHAGIGPQKKED